MLTKIGKESNCEDINPWIRPCENHLSWSATSTSSGEGNVILAKFHSFLGHIINKHDNLDNQLFNKCAHEEIEQREWIDERKLNVTINCHDVQIILIMTVDLLQQTFPKLTWMITKR